MPVANIAPPTSDVAAPPVIRPTPVPVSQSVQPIGPLDRAPANVNASTDPELPQPQSVPRVKVRAPAEVPFETPSPASTSVLPQSEEPVPDTADTDATQNVVPNQPQYLTVSANGAVVVRDTTTMNFIGNGVSVVANGTTALVTVVGDTTVLGNWGFVDNTQYNLNGGSIDNSDLSHGATATITIPANGSADTLNLLNYYGDIALTAAASPGSTKTWIFETTGNIILPTNSSSINYANGTPYGMFYGNSNVVDLLSSFGSNSISTTGNISGNLVAPAGNGSILVNANGVVGTASGFSYDANANIVFAPAISTQGSANTGINALYAGVAGFTVLGSTVQVQLTSDLNSYTQINTQNINPGSFASSDYIITADNGTDSTYYLDLGLAGSGHADPDFFGDTGSANDGYLYVTATDQAGPSSGAGNLLIGSTNGVVKLFVGNTAQANVIATVASDGISVTGNIVGTGAINVGDMSIGTVPGDITANANTGITVNVSGPDGGFAVNYLDEVGNANTSGGELAFSSELGNATYRISLSDDLGNGFATKIWRFDGTGSLTAPGNITTTGNITGNYILGNGSQLTSVNANTVDILNTNGLTTVYYPTFVENRTTGQIVRADVDFSYRTDNNTLTVGSLSTSGNITGNYILGNGSQLTGLPATYSNANVATFLASYGSNTISTTGNITAGNLIGNISITGNVTGTSANVTLVAGAYSTVFDNGGTATLPGALQLAVYANTTVRDTAIPSPTPGMMIYITGTGMQVRGATGWNTIAGSGT